MSLAAHRLLTYDEYLDLEQETRIKHEYVEGIATAMTGGSITHALLVAAVAAEFRNALKGSSCRVHSSEQRLLLGDDLHRRAYYPDLSVTCGPIPVHPDDRHAISEARYLVEVLSPNTTRYDTVHKANEYRKIPSLKAFWCVSAREIHIFGWRRKGQGEWVPTFHGPQNYLPLGDDRRVEVRDIYDGIPLDSHG